MSGFERAESSAAWTEAEERAFPDDFSPEEAAFAHDLRAFYALERDEPPPLYAQTLLGTERPEPAGAGFEQRILYAVFRRLNLSRPRLLADEPRETWIRATGRSIRESLLAVPRAMAMAGSALMALMALTMVLASPSFAAGLRLLLGHSGVQQVSSYPGNVQASRHQGTAVGSTLKSAGVDPRAPLYWLGPNYGDYVFAGVRELDQPEWAQGPLLDLTYISHTPGHVTTDTPPVLNIREFQVASPYSAVLQVVQDGYASEVTVGIEQAVYVDGGWVRTLDNAHLGKSAVWQSGVKSELILEYAGVIFWITGNQTYGVDQAALVGIAQHLLSVQRSQLTPHAQMTRWAGQELQAALADPSAGEVLALVPVGQSPSSGSASFVTEKTGPTESP